MAHTTRHINYKSDFILRERFRNELGEFVQLPDIDFEIRYWVKPGREFVASRQNGEYHNCTPDGDAILVVFKDHNFCEGPLKHELHLKLANDFMPDGVQNVYYPDKLSIELWQYASDSTGVLESDLVASYTRGYPFTWEDFTPAMIEVLQRPALDAAQRADTATEAAKSATKKLLKQGQDLATIGDQVLTDCRTATNNANAATNAANTAAQAGNSAANNANTAAGEVRRQAETLAETSGKAVKDCTDATKDATAATAKADTAADNAQAAAVATQSERELTEQSRQRLEAVADRAEQVAAPIPDGLRVITPGSVTLGNPVPQFISARVLPARALQNVIYQTFGGAAGVEPDGRILPFRPGVTRVHVIPTLGTRFFKTVEVQVVAPALRVASSGALRLDAAGNIRLT